MTAKKFLYLRTTLAFLLVPLIVPLLELGYYYATYGGLGSAPDPALTVVVTTVLAYVGTIFLGGPACLTLVWLNRTALIHAALVGFLIGVTMTILFIATVVVQPPGLFDRLAKAFGDNPVAFFEWGGAGALIAIIIWFVAKGPRHFHS